MAPKTPCQAGRGFFFILIDINARVIILKRLDNVTRMFPRLKQWIKTRHVWIAQALSVLGVIWYAVQSYRFAHTLISPLDEGNYLYKGWLFATGVYAPFQDYGVWTNKMPLAFLIPGWVQELFGAGLRTGRYFALVLGVLLMVALWLTTRRLAGHWWAAAVIWALALNPAMIKLYSMAISQGLVACMLAWSLYFLLGEKRKIWQILAGSLLAALMVLTRQNMVMVLPIALIYIFWQHGRRAGWLALATMAIPVVVVHWMYWPNILQIWTPWLPKSLTPFLDFARVSVGGTAGSKVGGSSDALWLSFWEGVRFHLLPLAGTLFAIICFPRRSDWKSGAQFKTSIFLIILMLVLTGMHLMAALGSDYCPYCSSLYLAFFSFVGLLVTAVSFSAWTRRLSIWRQALVTVLVLSLFTGIGFGGYQGLTGLLTLQVPRVSGMQFLPGTTDLWRLLANKFDVSYKFLEIFLPAVFLTLIGALFISLGVALSATLRRRRILVSSGWLVITGFLALGLLLSPIPALAGAASNYDCDGSDIILAYEQAGAVLARQLPEGSTVYWHGGLSPVPLLYIPDIQIYPPQLNNWYNFRVGGNTDLILKRGGWNDVLSKKWLSEADYILVEDRNYRSSFWNAISPDIFDELTASAPIKTCTTGSQIRIFRRKQ